MFNKTLFIIVIIFTFNKNDFTCNAYKVTDQVYFDIKHGNDDIGRIIIGLFGEIAPKTVENFKIIATIGINNKSYAGSLFHRVIPRFMIQGGDIIFGDGRGSTSIFGDEFEDENFEVKHNGAGFISMVNHGSNSNGCQFFITTIQTHWLDEHHVIFGKVIKGQNIVHKIEHVKADVNDRPIVPVIIYKSGLLEKTGVFEVYDEEYNLMAIVRAGYLPLGFSFAILAFFHSIIRKLDRCGV